MLLKYQIGVNENIIWSGTKDVKVSVMEAIFNPLLPFAIIWFILDFFIISRTAMNGAILLFFLVHLMPVWLYLFGVLTASLKARHTEYVITTKGIYIQSGIFTTVTEMKPFTDLSHVNVRTGVFDKICGTGDVITVCSHSGSNGHSHGMNIENISDYEYVFRLIKELQEAIYSDTMYPNGLRPMQNPGYNTQYNQFYR
jgi:membrane protein YdbS with pleckstrin-like domain